MRDKDVRGGAPLSFTLVSIYLVASGAMIEGVALFIWGSVELFIVDKTVRPRLVGGPIKLPFLPTFFGLVGGVKTMGFLGLFIGPARGRSSPMSAHPQHSPARSARSASSRRPMRCA